MLFSFKRKSLKKDSEAQLFLIGGVMITVVIIGLAVVSIEIPEATKSYSEENFLKTDYNNVREEFGIALQDELGDKLQYISGCDDEVIISYFNEIRGYFAFAAYLHGNDFSASYNDVGSFFSSSGAEMRVVLMLGNDEDFIEEEVVYYIIPDSE